LRGWHHTLKIPALKETSMKWLVFVVALAGCVGSARITATSSSTLVVKRAPPQPLVEAAATTERPGFVWIGGRWAWQNESWQWLGGRWEKERTGRSWRAGRWERRGDEWHWVEGEWIGGGDVRDHRREPDGDHVRDHRDEPARDPYEGRRQPGSGLDEQLAELDDETDESPPAPKAESPGTKPGHVWVTGRWRYKNKQWTWVAGSWKPQHGKARWVQGGWTQRGRRWVYVGGHWED
jgi:hypothetical protein